MHAQNSRYTSLGFQLCKAAAHDAVTQYIDKVEVGQFNLNILC